MKAYVLAKPLQLEIQERDIPQPKSNDVLIKVTNIGICGSDIHLYKGTYNGPYNYPMLFGHEWSGIVEKTGDKVTDLKAGDRVTGDCSKFCGKCSMCQKDKNLCSEIEKYGITVDGASAEYIVRDRKHIYRAVKNADLELLALTEPISVAKHLIERIIEMTDDITGKKILIYGGGAIGQAAFILLKKYYGCSSLDLSDLVEYRTALAKEFGANIPTQEELKWDYPGDYFSMYNRTKYDIIIETTGVAPVFINALNLLKPRGILGCVGMIAKAEIPQKLIVTKALTVVGSIGGTGEFEDVIRFINENPDTVHKLISHKFKAADSSEAFKISADVSKSMKVVLEL